MGLKIDVLSTWVSKRLTGEITVGDLNGVWLTRTVRRKTTAERWEQSNLEMMVAVPWRKNEDDEQMAGERFKREVVLMDEDQEKLEMEEHVPVPKRVCTSHEDLETVEFSARCLGCLSMLQEATRQAHTEGCRKKGWSKS